MALINKIRVLFSEVVAALGYTPENPANKGVANGYAGLDATGKVPSGQLPAYVDDVLEYASLASFPVTGSTGIIYVALDTNIIYRWSGSTYIQISSNDVLSVFGRTGTITAQEGDYSFTQLSDVNLTSPTAGQIIQNDGTAWVNWTPDYLSKSGGTMTGNIAFAGSQPWPTFNQNTTGNAATATALQTARTINGVSFNGTANITLTANTTQALTISGPLTGGSFNGGTATTLGIQTANGTQAGALSSTDWTTFNNKQAAISLTTTGSSGAATFENSKINVPTYTLSGLGGQPALNGTGFVKITNTTVSYDNSTYLTANQNITLSGDVTGSGATAITATLAASGVTAGTYTNATVTVNAKGLVTSISSPNTNKVNASYLLVGGGGGSGFNGGGGGGGGGVLTGTTTLTVGTVYSFVIGGGGVGATGSTAGSVGGSTTGLGLTAVGGGGGSGRDSGSATGGATGGGAAGTLFSTAALRLAAAGAKTTIAGQGFNGGNSSNWSYGGDLLVNSSGGGGGGAGSSGNSGTSQYGGYGGLGVFNSITGSSVEYGGGGGGGVTVNGTGGAATGGGGRGGAAGSSAQAGTNGLGGGGGGAGPVNSGGGTGLTGGNGVAIIRLPTANYTGTVTGEPTVTIVGSDTVIQFTSNGSYTA